MNSKIIREIREQLAQPGIDERLQIDLMNNLSFEIRDNDIAESFRLGEEAYRLSQQLSDGTVYKRGMAFALVSIGQKKTIIGQHEESFSDFMKALEIFKEINDREGKAYTNISMATHYWGIGEYNKAIETAIEGYKLVRNVKNPVYRGWSLFFLGVFYSDLKNYDHAIDYFTRCLEAFSSIEYENGMGRTFNSLSVIYQKAGEYDKALDHAFKALAIHEGTGYSMGIARSLNDLGSIYTSMSDYERALEYLCRSLEIREKANSKQATITTLTELGEVHVRLEKYSDALHYLDRAKAIAGEINARGKLLRIHQLLVDIHKLANEPWKALENMEKCYELQSYMLSQDADSKVKNVEAKFLAEHKKQETEIYRLKNVELKKAYEQIEEKNKEITDSIRYAMRIQEAMLPRTGFLERVFPHHFVLFKPKDIVSGDFYWAAEKNGKKIIAVVDCTGHGVPGAFMSMVGNSILNRIVNEKSITEPGLILDMLRDGVISALQQTGAEGESKDGMDIALCVFDAENGTVEYAGANNPLWIIRAGKKEASFSELRPDKMPIGVQAGDNRPFSTAKVKLEKGDVCYLFSDGFADQFGGSSGKKMMKKHFRELLLEVSKLELPVQREAISQAFDDWKGEHEQVDDVLVIGVGALIS